MGWTMREYVIDGIKIKVIRESKSDGPTILEHMVNYLLDLMESSEVEVKEE